MSHMRRDPGSIQANEPVSITPLPVSVAPLTPIAPISTVPPISTEPSGSDFSDFGTQAPAEPPVSSKRRGASKLIKEDPPEDDYDSYSGGKEFGSPSRDFGSSSKSSKDFGGAGYGGGGSGSGGGSPLVKALGAIILVMALLKVPALITFMPGYLAQPGGILSVLDMLGTTGGLLLCGLALLLSKN